MDAPDGGVVEIIHGARVEDPFRWLEDAQDARVTAWVAAHDAKARSALSGLPGRAEVAGELRAIRRLPAWGTLPTLRNGKYIYERRDADRERGALFEYDPSTKHETVLLDLDSFGVEQHLEVDAWALSRSGRFLVARVSPFGNDVVEGRVYDLVLRRWLDDRVADIRYGYPVWDPSGKGFYYSWSPTDPSLTGAQRTAQTQIRYHVVGTPAESDERVRPAPNEAGIIEVPDVSRDGRWLEVGRWGPDRNAIFLAKRNVPTRDWIRVTPEGPFHYRGELAGDLQFIHTTEGAPHGRLFRVDLSKPARSAWREIIPEREDSIIQSVDVIGDQLIVGELRDAETHFVVRGFDGSQVRELQPPQIGSITSFGVQRERVEAVGSFATYTQPYTPFFARPPRFALETFPFAERPGTDDRYVTEKVFYTSPDGTRAPIFLVHARDMRHGKPAPLILYAYGAFGESTTPLYHQWLRPWLDRGGVYAEAVLRGGGEYGEAWHLAGKREKRPNVYADFLAASDFLVHEGWTDPTKLVIRGASAGGLLVAVAMTERPELFAGVICQVPLTDMVRFQHGIGNGTLWGDEFGSPEDEHAFQTLLRYSPYHRVRPGVHYPPLLMVSAAEDDRVDPMHARKLAARLEAADPSARVLLRTREAESHRGATRTSTWVDDETEALTFALDAVGAAKK